MYKIIVGIPKQGIERSLPYRIEGEFMAGVVARALDTLFSKEGYIHRYEPVDEASIIKPAARERRKIFRED